MKFKVTQYYKKLKAHILVIFSRYIYISFTNSKFMKKYDNYMRGEL